MTAPGGPTQYEVCTTASGCKIGVYGYGSGQFNSPAGIAVDCRDAVWVPNGAHVQRFGEPSTAAPPCPSGGSGGSADTTPPNGRLGKHPKKRTHKRKAKFTFFSDEQGSSFKCKLDKKPFSACRSRSRG